MSTFAHVQYICIMTKFSFFQGRGLKVQRCDSAQVRPHPRTYLGYANTFVSIILGLSRLETYQTLIPNSLAYLPTSLRLYFVPQHPMNIVSVSMMDPDGIYDEVMYSHITHHPCSESDAMCHLVSVIITT